jgi:hypothetical protein
MLSFTLGKRVKAEEIFNRYNKMSKSIPVAHFAFAFQQIAEIEARNE